MDEGPHRLVERHGRRQEPKALTTKSVAASLVLAVATLLVATNATPTRAAEPGEDARLPDLAVLPLSDLKIVVRDSGRRVLRFTSIVVNVGQGPFQLAGFDAKDGQASIGDTLAVRQQILEADGTFTNHLTAATMFWSGDGHNHWHVTDIQVAALHSLDAVDLGVQYRKTGFCFFDSYRYTSTKPAYYTTARSVCQVNANDRVRMGVSVKWGDIYPSTIAYQWIDITDVPDGKYKLKVFADPVTDELPGGNFIESDDTNNKGWVKIRIQGQSVKILDRSARP